ncbi:MAG: hypothetical protein ACTSRZ_03690 [Promethearchaeota archaeon]
MTDWSNINILIVTIIEYISFIIITRLNVEIYRKYKSRKSKTSYLLFNSFFALSLTPILQSMDTFFLDDLTIKYLGYIASFGYASAFVCSAISNYYLAQFIMEIFNYNENEINKTKQEAKAKIIGKICLINIAIFFVFKILNDPIISTIFLGIHVMISIIIFSNLSINSFKIAHYVEDPLMKGGLNSLGCLGILFNAAFILFVFEAIFAYQTYSIFSIFGWFLAVIGVFCGYIGFCMPKWLLKIYTKDRELKHKIL